VPENRQNSLEAFPGAALFRMLQSLAAGTNRP
jgi:hypothetical protein